MAAAQQTLFRFDADGTPDAAPFDGSGLFFGDVTSEAVSDGAFIYPRGTTFERYGLVPNVQRRADGVVAVWSEDAADTLTVVPINPTTLRFTLNGESFDFDRSTVTGVQLDLHEGDNHIDVTADIGVTLQGGAGDDTITTAGGNDLILARAGEATVHMGAGDDLIDTGDISGDPVGRNTLTGTGGNKKLYLRTGVASIDLAAGDHVVNLDASGNGNQIHIAGGSSTVYTSGGSLTLAIDGNGANSITLVSADADVTTGDGSDSVLNWAEDATIHTGGGNDLVSLGTSGGTPVVFAGAGDDVIRYLNVYASNAVLHGEEGNDTIVGARSPRRSTAAVARTASTPATAMTTSAAAAHRTACAAGAATTPSTAAMPTTCSTAVKGTTSSRARPVAIASTVTTATTRSTAACRATGSTASSAATSSPAMAGPTVSTPTTIKAPTRSAAAPATTCSLRATRRSITSLVTRASIRRTPTMPTSSPPSKPNSDALSV
ncbi:MAG: calcium-binding protein [Tepidisphaeraceae bacterium]